MRRFFPTAVWLMLAIASPAVAQDPVAIVPLGYTDIPAKIMQEVVSKTGVDDIFNDFPSPLRFRFLPQECHLFDLASAQRRG